MKDPNVNRPGYKKTRVGWIPNVWDCVDLHAVVDPKRPISYGVVQTGEPVPNGIPCVRVTDLVADGLDPQTMIKTTEVINRQYRRTILKTGDLIIALRGEVGKVVVTPPRLAGANITRGVALLSKSSVCYPLYLKEALGLESVRSIIRLNINGTALKEIPIVALRRIPVPVPPTAEQERIYGILAACSDVIDLTRDLIDAKREQKQALMQQLLTGKKRLPGFAEKWKTARLDQISTRLREVAENPAEYPVLSITAGTGFVSQQDKFSRVIAGKQVENYVRLKRGEFAYNKGNSYRYPQGCVYQLTEYEEGLVPDVFYSFKLDDKRADAEFIKQYFLAGLHNKDLYRWINSGVRNNGLLNLSASDFFNLPIQLPGLSEQKEIGRVMKAADDEINALASKLAGLKEQKKGLMQKLLTGQIRVRV